MSTIAEILANGPGKSVRLTARVKRAFDGKSGVGARGPWTRQDFELEDATGTLKVEWWGNDLGKNQLQGQTVTLAPGSDGKGCYLKEKEGTNGRPPSMVVSCDGPGKVTLAQAGLALAQVGVSAGQQGGTPTVVPAFAGPMNLDDYLATTARVAAFCRDSLGLTDEQAIASITDCCMIAVSQGRVQGVKADDPPFDIPL